MQGYCTKRGRKVDDRKVIEYCLKQNSKQGCKNLRLQTERRKDRNGRKTNHKAYPVQRV